MTDYTAMPSARFVAPMTVNQAAEYMNCSRWTVYRLVRDGKVAPLKVGNRLRFRCEELDRYMQSGG